MNLREQLGKVLALVSVSGQEEEEAQLLLKRLQAVEEEVRGGEEKKEERSNIEEKIDASTWSLTRRHRRAAAEG